MDPVLRAIAGPLEYASAPFWYHKKEALYFVDVFKSEIHKYDTQSNQHTFARVGRKPVAFVIPIEDFDHKFLIGYGEDLVAVTWDEKSADVSQITALENVDPLQGNVISDGKVSPSGTLFVGTSGPGHLATDNLQLNRAGLYNVKNWAIKKIIPNISTSGGMAWNEDESIFYYVDSAEYRIERYRYDKQTGDLREGCTLYEFKDDCLPGFPCGMTIDDENQLWVSCFSGGQVIRINSQTGKSTYKIEIPLCPQITSITFGGRDLCSLFVTTASFRMSNSTTAGCVFEVRGLEVRGCMDVPLRLNRNQKL